ncbi:MAG: HAMP domain-containing sensor histidine kinase [Patescibacteria group bacterium]
MDSSDTTSQSQNKTTANPQIQDELAHVNEEMYKKNLELADTKKQLENANERLKEVDKLKDEFVSLASHELRTPMTVIKSYVFMLLNKSAGELTNKQKTYLERTLSSTERLINLVNDMLNVSRIESGKLTIEPVPADIGKLVYEVVTEMQTRASEMDIKLVYTQPTSPLISNADINRIKQVLINLIGNSFKFTPKGGMVKIELTQNEKDFALIKVSDTGRGISSADMAKLFIKFSMVGNNRLTKDKGQGTGLGLYLSKSLIELHGGKIWAQSEGEGKGSTFSFTLPLDSSDLELITGTVATDSPGQKTNKSLPPESNHLE